MWENRFTYEHKKKMGQGMQMPTWKDASAVHWMINKAVFALMQHVFKFFLLDKTSDKKFDIYVKAWFLYESNFLSEGRSGAVLSAAEHKQLATDLMNSTYFPPSAPVSVQEMTKGLLALSSSK